MEKDEFLYSINPYYGQFKQKYQVFNYKLQQFSTQTSYICNLVTNNKISLLEGYQQIELLWIELENLANDLNINDY